MLLPSAEVRFVEGAGRIRPLRLDVLRQEYGHEVIVATFRERDLSAVRYRSDNPVQVSWGVGSRARSQFVGYVHHVEPHYRREDTELPLVELYLIGPTRSLLGDQDEVWQASRPGWLTRQRANEQRLATRVLNVGRALTNVTQSGDGWDFLVRKAKGSGLVLFAEETTLYLLNPDQTLSAERDTAEVIDVGSGRVIKLDPITGELNPEGHQAADHVGYGVGTNGKLVAARDRTPSDTREQREPRARIRRTTRDAWQDVAEITRDLHNARQLTKYVYFMNVEVQTDRVYRVAEPLYFAGFGDRYDGMWRVVAADTSLGLGQRPSATTKLKLSRYTEVAQGGAPRTPFQRTTRPAPAQSRLLGARWVAEVAA